jgi:hypothetical protein
VHAGALDADCSTPVEVELNWQFAADALDEAIKFLPERADHLPEERRSGLHRTEAAAR